MSGFSPRTAANAYSTMNMETGVLAADPHKLILMLFDGAMAAIHNSIQQIQSGKIVEKGKSIAHAMAIVEHGLRASLNKEVGGELAQNLDGLYSYMVRQLLIANVRNDISKLVEVRSLLGDLKSAWEQIAPNKAAREAQAQNQNPVQDNPAVRAKSPFDSLAPRKSGYISA